MMVFYLVFIACAGFSTDHCRRVELPWDGGFLECVYHGQMGVAQWVVEHPGWSALDGYRCVSGRPA